MINYLILPVSKNSKSFCYYESSEDKSRKKEIIDFTLLKEAVLYAIKNKCGLNVLYGDEPLPAKYELELEKIKHIKILPLKLRKYYPKGIYIIEESDLKSVKKIKKNNELNLILRLKKNKLPEISEIFGSLLWKFKRLNLLFTDIPNFTDNDFKEYEKQLYIIGSNVYKLFHNMNNFELNFLTDRLFLQNMNNCDAGIKHITIAPDGKFYLCPGFYYDNNNNALGDLEKDFIIKNENLLQLKNAPLCSNCDSWHCKRCYYLNQKITLEINTPSSQQCIISHIERNQTRIVSDKLKMKFKFYKRLVPIPELDYFDPYEILNIVSGLSEDEKIDIISELLSKPLEKLTTRELLMCLYQVDKESLIKLKNHLKIIYEGKN
jgi:CXXX repeat peptide maturase